MPRSAALALSVLGAAWVPALAGPADAPASQPAGQAAPSEAASAPATQPAGGAVVSPLRLDQLTFDLGLDGRVDRRHVRQDGGDGGARSYRQTDFRRALEETAGVRSSGVVVDDRVMQFDLAGRWGLTQERFSEARPGYDLREDSHGDVLEYDLSTTFLPRGVLSGNAYASRLESRVPRLFLPSLDRTQEKYGAGLYFNDRAFPMQLTFEHLWDELTSRTHDLQDDEQRGHDRLRYEGTWQISEQHAVRLEYEHEERVEQYSGNGARFDTTRDYVVLNHALRFGPEDRSVWETTARLQDERGDLARDIAEVSSRLRLQHTDSLASNYGAQFLHEAFKDLSTDTWRGEAGLTHQLGQTLTSTVQLYGLRQGSNENADFGEWGGLASAAFSRENPFGRLSANLSYNHSGTTTDDGTQRGVVIGESVTFRDPLPSYLAHTDLDRFTVIVTDSERRRMYLFGRDYLIVPLGRYTALQRVPTGQITDGQTVLVTYLYRASSDYNLRRDRLDFRLQQDFRFGLSPYYAASLQDEDLDNVRFQSFRGRDVNRQRLGATYRQPRWSAGLEYEYNDDAIDPYQAVHANGDAVLWQKAQHQLDAKGMVSRFWFEGAEDLSQRDTTLLDLGASYRYLLADYLEASASAAYRYEDDSLQGITNGVDLSASLEWKLGQFCLRLEAEYDLLSLTGSRDDSFSIWLKLRRDIPVIARSD